MPVLPPNKGRSKSTSRGKSKKCDKPPMEELVNTTLQAKDQENQRGGLNVISQPSVRGPSKKRGGAAFFQFASEANGSTQERRFRRVNKVLEERRVRRKEKAIAIVRKGSKPPEEEEEEEEEEVDDGFELDYEPNWRSC